LKCVKEFTEGPAERHPKSNNPLKTKTKLKLQKKTSYTYKLQICKY